VNKLKILCVIDDLAAGGAQRQLVNLAIELKIQGHDLSFLTYNHRRFYESILQDAEIKNYLIDERTPILRLFKFRKFIRSGNYNAVISFLGVPSFLASFAAFPFKKFVLIVGERSSNPKIRTSARSRLTRVFYPFANYIVSNSYANNNLVKSIYPFISDKKFKVIYNGIDLNKFKSDSIFSFRSKSRFQIIVPASYRRLKNLIGLIEAVNLLDKTLKDGLLIRWFGDKSKSSCDDNMLEEAVQLIRNYSLDDVFELNNVTHEISSIMKNCDAVGLFSFFEGLPNSICEGLSCSKPIVATAVSDIPLLIEEGVNGFVCLPNCPSSIAQAIEKLLKLNATELIEMGNRNRQKANKLFGQIDITKAYEALLIKK
jgi:glycosyltransferase involved in cell wall biosynthesis